jgi:hypothetical protein
MECCQCMTGIFWDSELLGSDTVLGHYRPVVRADSCRYCGARFRRTSVWPAIPSLY